MPKSKIPKGDFGNPYTPEEARRLLRAKKSAGLVGKRSANQLTSDIIRWLDNEGWDAWRNNTMGVFDGKKAAMAILELISVVVTRKHTMSRKVPAKMSGLFFSFIKSGDRLPSFPLVMSVLSLCYRKTHERKGAPDILAFHRKFGIFLTVEVKVKGDTMKPEQLHFAQTLNRSKYGTALVAKTWQGFVDSYCEKVAPIFGG